MNHVPFSRLEDIPYRLARLVEDKLIRKIGTASGTIKGAFNTLSNKIGGIDPKKLGKYGSLEEQADAIVEALLG